MNHKLWESLQYRLAALPSPQMSRAQASYDDAWYAVNGGYVTEESAIRRLTKLIKQLEREGKERQNA